MSGRRLRRSRDSSSSNRKDSGGLEGGEDRARPVNTGKCVYATADSGGSRTMMYAFLPGRQPGGGGPGGAMAVYRFRASRQPEHHRHAGRVLPPRGPGVGFGSPTTVRRTSPPPSSTRTWEKVGCMTGCRISKTTLPPWETQSSLTLEAVGESPMRDSSMEFRLSQQDVRAVMTIVSRAPSSTSGACGLEGSVLTVRRGCHGAGGFLDRIERPSGKQARSPTTASSAWSRSPTYQPGHDVIYAIASDPLKDHQVTDPLGEAATFQYDELGRLVKITDVIGITSEFSMGRRFHQALKHRTARPRSVRHRPVRRSSTTAGSRPRTRWAGPSGWNTS
jgi:YD repeat-containing protein